MKNKTSTTNKPAKAKIGEANGNVPVMPRFFCYEVETCGCCWHYYLWEYKFGFGEKDGSPYIELFGKTFWWYKIVRWFKKNQA